MALGNLLRRTLAPASLCALALAACGSQQAPRATKTNLAKPPKHDNQTVWIYSSLPSAGPERATAAQIRLGIRLALDPVENTSYHGFRVHYTALNDSRLVRHRRVASSSPSTRDRAGDTVTTTTVTNSDGWNATATVNNAEQAARNPPTIAYIGDLDSGATALSLPILNQAGILQITPGSGYPGLTDAYKGVTQLAEPGKYYPHTPKTLLRLIPSDIVQAAATVDVLSGTGCQQVGVWSFSGKRQPAEVTALAHAVALTAPEYKMTVPNVGPLPAIKDIQAYAESLHNHIRCAVFVGRVTPAAIELATELRLQIGATIVGTSGLCKPSWVSGIAKLVSKAEARTVAAGLYCTTPVLPLREYAGNKSFIARFEGTYPRQRPTPYAYYGYEAAEMVLRALGHIGSGQDNRLLILNALVDDYVGDATKPFSFDPNGNTQSDDYGVDVFVDGVPTWHKTVTPFPLLSSGG